MEHYFEEHNSIISLLDKDIEKILEKMTERFISENPAEDFTLRTYYEKGMGRTKKGAVILDFAAWFPQANYGDCGVAIGELLCCQQKESRFLLTCVSESIVFLNQERVLQCQEAGTYEFVTKLKKGKNRFLIVSKKEKSFQCFLQNKMPQWEPYSYIMPFRERKGEAGFVYQLFQKEKIQEQDIAQYFLGEQYWGNTEKGDTWNPSERKTDVNRLKRGYWYVWTRVRCFEKNKEKAFAELLAWLKQKEETWGFIQETRVNGKSIEICEKEKGDTCEISWMLCGEESEKILEIFQELKSWQSELPVSVHGDAGEFLFLGPLGKENTMMTWQPSKEEFLTVPFHKTTSDLFWRTKYADIAIRPFVETALYGRWTYPLGVTLYGILMAGRYYQKQVYIDYVRNFMKQVIVSMRYAEYDKEKYGFPGIGQQILWLDALDDCGSFGSCMLECIKDWDNKEVKEEAERIAHRIYNYMRKEQVRNLDGSFKRRDNTMWIDDIYMSVPFLIRYGERFQCDEAIQEAVNQLLLYRDHFCYKPEGMEEQGYILSHMYKLDYKKPNEIPWSRGNGWVIFSLSELLLKLSLQHEKRSELVQFFQSLCAGYERLQDKEGLWHQILDEPDTYYETSGTAMFICAFSRGILYEWVQEEKKKQYTELVSKAFQGLTRNAIDREGNLYGVCQGSGWSYERDYYRKLSWNFNDTHGIGIVILAGVEVDKLLNKRKVGEGYE